MKGFLLSVGALLVGLGALLVAFWSRARSILLRRSSTGLADSPLIRSAGDVRRDARRERIVAIKREREETIKCRAERARKEIEQKFGRP